MLPAAGEGEVCRQSERKAAARPTAVVRPTAVLKCTAIATAVGFMQVSHGCRSGERDPLPGSLGSVKSSISPD